jgi:hypothetical protein
VEHLPHSGPRSRTSPRSSSRCLAGKEASTIIPPDGASQGLICPHYNNMEGERSNHDGVSPADGGTAARNQPPLQATSHSPRRTTSTSPFLASPPPRSDRCHGEAAASIGRPLLWFSQMHCLVASLCSK